MKSNKELCCPRCQGTKIVCNGVKKSGKQNYRCKECGRQFQDSYQYAGCIVLNRELVVKALCRGSGVRDCCALSGMSKAGVLKLITSRAASIALKPKKRHYSHVQIDEQWSYVGKKEKKVWMLYAYAPQEDEILGFAMGKRSAETVRRLMMKLKGLDIQWFLTDWWEAFAAVLPAHKHLSGKQYTKNIEGINTWFRTRVRRLMRKTTCFSKKLIYHYSMIKIIIYHRNLKASYI